MKKSKEKKEMNVKLKEYIARVTVSILILTQLSVLFPFFGLLPFASRVEAATISLTNMITNGSFESNITGWSGYMTDNKGAQSNLNPTQQNILAPSHGETGTRSLQMGTKTQGKVYTNPATPITTVVGHKYYIRAQTRLRGSTAGVVSVCTAYNGQSVPAVGAVIPTPLSDGLQTTNTTAWTLIDSIWTANTTSLNLRFLWQTTANQGNNDLYGQLDNVVMIDLTQAFGAGNEPPLFAIREGVNNKNALDYPGSTPPNGHWDGTKSIVMPTPPVIDTLSIPSGLKGRSYSEQIEIQSNTGTEPFVYNISGLPAGSGLNIDSNGYISGTVNLNEGAYNITVSVSDHIGYQTSKNYTLNIFEPPLINDDYMRGAVLNEIYSFTPNVTGSNGNLSVSIDVTEGSLPTGLSISGTTISGTPTVDGQTCKITITAENDYDIVTKVFTLDVVSAPRINTVSPLTKGILNTPYSLALNASGVEPITWAIVGGSLPQGLSLNQTTGVISGTPTDAEGAYAFTIEATNSLGSDTRAFMLNLYELPVITTNTLGNGRPGTPYSAQLTATGTQPISFWQVEGNLPVGLSLNSSTGIISGEPTEIGTYNFTVIASNEGGDSQPKALSILITNALLITTTSPLRNGTVGVAYGNLQFQAVGVDGSYATSWTWTGNIPGMTFNATTGILSGTPTTANTYNFNVTVTNGSSNSTVPFTLTVGTPPVITSNPTMSGSVFRPFTTVLQANSTTPVTWAITSGPTPAADIQLTSNGVVTAVVGTEGVYTFTVVASNTFGNSAPVQFTLTITTPSIVDVLLDYGIVGEAYSHEFIAGGIGPFTWKLVSGSLPQGVTFDPGTGILSGIPGTDGTYNFRLQVENSTGIAEENFALTIVTKPKITTTALNSGNVSSAYLQNLQATGTTPITWSILPAGGGETGLPPGLMLSGSTISGTPGALGTYTFTVQAQNVTGIDYADTKQYTITIRASGVPVITTGATLSAKDGVPYTLTLTATGNPTIAFALDGGSTLPSGLSLSNGIISGTPDTPGVYYFTINATNGNGNDSKQFTMTVASSIAPVEITYVEHGNTSNVLTPSPINTTAPIGSTYQHVSAPAEYIDSTGAVWTKNTTNGVLVVEGVTNYVTVTYSKKMVNDVIIRYVDRANSLTVIFDDDKGSQQVGTTLSYALPILYDGRNIVSGENTITTPDGLVWDVYSANLGLETVVDTDVIRTYVVNDLDANNGTIIRNVDYIATMRDVTVEYRDISDNSLLGDENPVSVQVGTNYSVPDIPSTISGKTPIGGTYYMHLVDLTSNVVTIYYEDASLSTRDVVIRYVDKDTRAVIRTINAGNMNIGYFYDYAEEVDASWFYNGYWIPYGENPVYEATVTANNYEFVVEYEKLMSSDDVIIKCVNDEDPFVQDKDLLVFKNLGRLQVGTLVSDSAPSIIEKDGEWIISGSTSLLYTVLASGNVFEVPYVKHMSGNIILKYIDDSIPPTVLNGSGINYGSRQIGTTFEYTPSGTYQYVDSWYKLIGGSGLRTYKVEEGNNVIEAVYTDLLSDTSLMIYYIDGNSNVLKTINAGKQGVGTQYIHNAQNPLNLGINGVWEVVGNPTKMHYVTIDDNNIYVEYERSMSKTPVIIKYVQTGNYSKEIASPINMGAQPVGIPFQYSVHPNVSYGGGTWTLHDSININRSFTVTESNNTIYIEYDPPEAITVDLNVACVDVGDYDHVLDLYEISDIVVEYNPVDYAGDTFEIDEYITTPEGLWKVKIGQYQNPFITEENDIIYRNSANEHGGSYYRYLYRI